MASLTKSFIFALPRVWTRSVHTTGFKYKARDARDLRQGHIKKSDAVTGEKLAMTTARQLPFELIDENLMDKVINNMKFRDIPRVHIKCTRNNTKITLVMGENKILANKSCGTEGFKNCRKGTTVAAQAVANRVVTSAKDLNIQSIRLVFDGLGPGRDAAYKVFEMSGLSIVSFSDRTEAIEPFIKRPRKAKSI